MERGWGGHPAVSQQIQTKARCFSKGCCLLMLSTPDRAKWLGHLVELKNIMLTSMRMG